MFELEPAGNDTVKFLMAFSAQNCQQHRQVSWLWEVDPRIHWEAAILLIIREARQQRYCLCWQMSVRKGLLALLPFFLFSDTTIILSGTAALG